MSIRISLSGRLFEESYQKNTLTMREFAETAAGIGYQGVELRTTQVTFETPDHTVREYRQILKDYGLEVVSLEARGYPVLDDEDLFRRFLDLAAQFDCALMRTGGDPFKTARCAETAATRHIRIGLNNHIGTEEKPGWTETIERTVTYLRLVNHPNFCILYDACHLFMSGSDYGPDAIRKIAGSIFSVLVQSLVETDSENGTIRFHGRYFRNGDVGEKGGPDLKRVIDGLRLINYDGYVGVIAPMPENGKPLDTAERYHRYIRNLLEST